MIQQQELLLGQHSYLRTWSDAGCYVVRDEISYDEAFDPAGSDRVYTEGAPISEE